MKLIQNLQRFWLRSHSLFDGFLHPDILKSFKPSTEIAVDSVPLSGLKKNSVQLKPDVVICRPVILRRTVKQFHCCLAILWADRSEFGCIAPEQPAAGLAMNRNSSPMGPRPQHKSTTWWRRCLRAVLHILGPITVPDSCSTTKLACVHLTEPPSRPLIKAAQNIDCHFVCVLRKCMSTTINYYPSIQWISFPVYFRIAQQ